MLWTIAVVQMTLRAMDSATGVMRSEFIHFPLVTAIVAVIDRGTVSSRHLA